MAKNKTNYYGGASKKKNGAVGIIVAVTIAALLLGAAVGVMGYGTSGFKDWGFSRFAHKTPAAYEQHEEVPEETGAAIVEPTKGNGMTMLARQATAEEAAFYGIAGVAQENIFTLSVTYEPEDTTFQETDYSIAFKNPGSEWAQGKNVSDYATLTHTEDSKEATVSVLKAFSEQVIVTASNQKHPEVRAATTIDYVCENLVMSRLDSERLISVDSDICLGSFAWKEGTIEPEGQNHVYILIDLQNAFVQHMQKAGFTCKQVVEYAITNELYFKDKNGDDEDSIQSFKQCVYDSCAEFSGYEQTKKKQFDDALAQYFKSFDKNDMVAYYNFKYDRYYNGKNYGTIDRAWEEDNELYFEDINTYWEIEPQSLQTSHSSLIAG